MQRSCGPSSWSIGRSLLNSLTEITRASEEGFAAGRFKQLGHHFSTHLAEQGTRNISQEVLGGSAEGLRLLLGCSKQTLRGSQGCSGREWGQLVARRWQSSSGPSTGSREAAKWQQRLSSAVLGGSNATTTAKQGAAKFGSSLYSRLPSQAKQLLRSASQPGSIQKVLKLQLEAFWGSHGRKVLAVGGVFVVYALWRTLFKVTSIFVNLSETMADFGFLALAAALAAFGFLYFRRLYTINPDSVYRNALLQLNTNPGVLEVMGAPVTGSSVRAVVQTGGGLRLKGLSPKFRSRRIQMIFPLTGSERRGLVSLEAKKLKGRYLFKLLAVDVPSAAGPEQRLFIEGDEKTYGRGGVIKELRDPFLHALSMREAHELEDEIDDAAEEARIAHQKRAKEVARLSRGPKPLDEGGGMYPYERLYWAVRRFFAAPKPFVSAEPSGTKAAGAKAAEGEPAKAAEKLDPGVLPDSPLAEQQRVHQLKKESSSQQAP